MRGFIGLFNLGATSATGQVWLLKNAEHGPPHAHSNERSSPL